MSKQLSNSDRTAVYQHLLTISDNGKLPRGSITDTAEKYNVSRLTIHRIWKRGNESTTQSGTPACVHTYRYNSGARPMDVHDIQQKIEAVHISNRTTFRRMEKATGISKSTLHRALQKQIIVRHRNSVKPLLSDANKIERLRFALENVHYISRNRRFEFKNMYNMVHIDEKWFHVMKVNEKYYLTPGEERPHRTTQSKKYIGKIMFLCALGRPRYNPATCSLFNGKIGIWPFVKMEAAVRSSKNRPAGTMEMKPINVTRDVYTEYLVDKVFPAIRSKFPAKRNTPILLQQDNARPHIHPNDPYIEAAGKSEGRSSDISIICQPPNSPDFNVLDLGFFNSIQSIQSKVMTRNIEELVEAVIKAFNDYPHDKITDVFLTLQSMMESTMEHNGGNNFKIPHKKKYQMTSSEKINYNIECDTHIYNSAREFYDQNRQ